jgi:outer membrane protein assembly factor BamB
MMRLICSFILAFFTAAASFGDVPKSIDWPQWQGRDRDGISREVGLLQEWLAAGPPLAWRVDGLGGGDSAPSIADGRMFGMSNRGDEEVVWALSESDGKELWVRPLGPALQQQFPQSKEGPGCTPTVDGDHLYVLGMSGALACLRVADGEIVWQRNLKDDFGGVPPMWNYRESPLVDGDKLICTPGANDATLVALDKMTGEVIWKHQPPAVADSPADEEPEGPRGGRGGFGRGRFGPGSGAAYSSPIAIDFGGKRQYVQLTAKALIGVDAVDGALLWEYRKPANGMGINCTTPLFHDGIVFASSAYGAGGGAVKLSANPDGAIEATEMYFTKRMQNHHGGIILLDGCLYGANGGNGGGNLICIDFQTGEVLWDERRGDRRVPKGAIAYADGRLYYRTEEGTVLLIEPSREQYIERGRFEQPDRTEVPAWSHPVVANGKLYIRDQDVLFCYDVKAQ